MRDLVRFFKYISVDSSTGCWEWTGCLDTGGYGIFSKRGIAHRWFYQKCYEVELPKKVFVLHSCDNKKCVNINHLRAGTHLDNMKDAHSRGRFKKGTNHFRSKLTDDDIREIRKLSLSMKRVDIAKIYQVQSAAICAIVSGRTWGHIK